MTLSWFLKSRPEGLPALGNFELREVDSAPLADGEIRVRNHWLSVEPSMRLRMNEDSRGYQPGYPLGDHLTGGSIGEVVESRSPDFELGDRVHHQLGWREEAVGPAEVFRNLPKTDLPEQHYVNVMGLIGFTAYVGVVTIGQGKAGETLFVSAAAGAVGSAAVQIGKILGMRVIGSAGGAEQCALVSELGADAVIDYKAAGTILDKLRAAAPDGIDVYFDNVGADHLDAALALANTHARFAISGMISAYSNEDGAHMRNLLTIVTNRIQLRGYMPRSDFPEALPEFERVMAGWIKDGKIHTPETVRNGIEAVPQAFVDLFTGGSRGKTLIRL